MSALPRREDRIHTPPAPAAAGGRPPAAVSLRRDERGRLVFAGPDRAEPLVGVRVARCFPWSRPERFISIRDADGKELCLLDSLADLEPQTRAVVEDELAAQELVPRISAVHSVDDRFDVQMWKVETDRGPIELQVKHAEDVRPLDECRILIRDHASGVFEVPDLAALDERSRERVEAHLP